MNRKSQTDPIRFDGQVVVITGAGQGLGRRYALDFAAGGAKVVINDPAVTRNDEDRSSYLADMVVEEVRASGGEAVPNYDSVATADGGRAIVETALSTYGRVDAIINNAAILRDKSFAKMDADTWNSVLSVQLHGAFYVSQPAFVQMRKQDYGRIVFMTSSVGLYGNFGQCNYAAAKMGLIGLMNALKIEGEKHDIKVNAVSPTALTPMTEKLFPPSLADNADPGLVSPMVQVLGSRECPVSGQIFRAGLGHFARVSILTAPGYTTEPENLPKTSDLLAHWDAISDMNGAVELESTEASLAHALNALGLEKTGLMKPEPRQGKR